MCHAARLEMEAQKHCDILCLHGTWHRVGTSVHFHKVENNNSTLMFT